MSHYQCKYTIWHSIFEYQKQVCIWSSPWKHTISSARIEIPLRTRFCRTMWRWCLWKIVHKRGAKNSRTITRFGWEKKLKFTSSTNISYWYTWRIIFSLHFFARFTISNQFYCIRDMCINEKNGQRKIFASQRDVAIVYCPNWINLR